MWSLALRNLKRDARRTGTTIAAVGIGVLGIALFLGYIHFLESALSEIVIHAEGNGHVQIYRARALSHMAAEPARFSLPAEQIRVATDAARSLPGVVLLTAQMRGVGMIQYQNRHAVFMAEGVDPKTDPALRASKVLGESGQERLPLDYVQRSADSAPVLVTSQLADLLGLDADTARGTDVQMSGATFENRLNAINGEIAGRFSTGTAETESKGIKLPLGALQSLYETQAVSRIVILLERRDSATSYARQLQQRLDETHPGVYLVTTWDHPAIGKIYDSFMGFFRMLFVFTGIIIAVIALTTVQHTVAMNITDRAREIGTLRSLGFGRGAVARMFAEESLLTATLGSAFGAIGALLVATGLAATHVTTTLPRISTPVELNLPIHPLDVGILLVIVPALCGLSSFLTARKGSKRPILHYLLPGRASSWAAVILAGGLALTASQSRGSEAMQAPSDRQLSEWLVKADKARGGYNSYTWALKIHSVDSSGATDTSYLIDTKNAKALAYTTEPPKNKGETILIDGRAMWFMKPGLRRPVSVSPRQRLVGQAANGDIASVQYSRDYSAALLGRGVVDGRDCYKLRLLAKNKAVTYDQILYYVDIRSKLGIRAEFLTVAGKPFKYATFQYKNTVITKSGSTPFVSTMRIVNSAFPSEYSVLRYDDVRQKDHPNSKFSLNNLIRF